MFSLFRALSLRYLGRRWNRSALVVASIALGVATLVSSRLLNRIVDVAAIDSTTPADLADLYVSNGEPGVRLGLADEVRSPACPAWPTCRRSSSTASCCLKLQNRAAVLFGVEVPKDMASPRMPGADKLKAKLTITNLLALAGRPALIGRKMRDDRAAAGLTDADPLLLRYTNAEVPFAVLGVIDVASDSPIGSLADSLVVCSVAEGARLTHPSAKAGGDDRVSRLDVFLEPGADRNAVAEAVRKVVGDRAEVRTPEENRKATEELIGGIKVVLTLCSFGALVVGLFLVYNALSVSVAERRHDIGVLRSLGATRLQVARLFATEALALGALGSLLGLPLGEWLSQVALSQFGDELNDVFINGSLPRPGLTLELAALALTGGIATALLAALVPAMQAAHDEPADAVRRAPTGEGGWLHTLHIAASLLLVGAGVGMVFLRHLLPPRTGSTVGLAVVLTGLFLGLPILVKLTAGLFQPLFRAVLGVEARLAADNLVRSPGRTGVVVGALAAGVSLMFQTAGVGRSNEEPVREWLDQVIRAEAFVFWGSLASSNTSMTPMPPTLKGKIAAEVPGVERVVGIRFVRPDYNGSLVCMLAMDAADYQECIRERMPEGLPTLDKFRDLAEGNVCIASDNFAAVHKKKVGDTIVLQGPRGPVELKLIGLGRDYTWTKGTLFVDRKRYVELFDDDFVDVMHVFFDRGGDQAKSMASLKEFAGRESLIVQDRKTVQDYLAGVIDRLYKVAYLQQIIVAVVAALGVVTALLISVLQRRRELGLLRAVGATRPQVLKTVLAEAVLMGVLGTVLGFALGLPMEWYLLKVVVAEESGFVFDLVVPSREALGIGVIAVGAAALAGLLPALNAVRLRITEAIAYE